MKILRILGYAAAFLVILVVVAMTLRFGLAATGASWSEMLTRAVTVILTWAIFWVAVWRPMGRRAMRSRSGSTSKPGQR